MSDDTDLMDRPADSDEVVDTDKVVDLFALDDEEVPKVYEDPLPLDEGVFEPRGLAIDVTEMGVKEWVNIGNELFLLEDRSPFWLGDWYLAGREKWGEEVNQLFDGDNAAEAKTASNHAIVCDKIPDEFRHDGCNFSVHRAAAGIPALPSIRKALRLAADGEDGVVDGVVIVEAHGEKWTEREMRRYVKAFKGEGGDDGEALKERGEATSLSYAITWNFALADEADAKAALEQLMGVAEAVLADHNVMPRGVSGPTITYNNS